MSPIGRLVGFATRRSKTIIVASLLLALLVGAGAANIEQSTEMNMFAEDPPEVEAEKTVSSQFGHGEANTTQLVVLVENESGDVLSRDSLLESLRYQRTLRDNESVNRTLAETRPFFGIENLVAMAGLRLDPEREAGREAAAGGGTGDGAGNGVGVGSGDGPCDGAVAGEDNEMAPLSEQIEQLEFMSDAEVAEIVSRLLDPEVEATNEITARALDLMPNDYEPGSSSATGRLTVVTQDTGFQVVSLPEMPADVREGQAAAADLGVSTQRDDYRFSGHGLLLTEEERSMGDSLTLVGPVAILLVLLTLTLAYRDPLDLALGILGILFVLVLTFGAMGWLGIDFQLMMVAAPVLLVGLSIDYCIHVVMRYREYRAGDGVSAGDGGGVSAGDGEDAAGADDGGGSDASGSRAGPQMAVRDAMDRGLTELWPALALVTVTAVIGFFSIVASGVPALQDFGVVTGIGIAGALLVFGVFVPALKVEIDDWLVARGHSRNRRAFGTVGRSRRLLAGIARVSARRPVSIVLVVLLLTGGAAGAGTQLDTNFSTDDYVPADAPAWAKTLPEPFAPGEYEVRETNQDLHAKFQSPDQQVDVLVEGRVTDPETLRGITAAEAAAAEQSFVYTRPTGEPAVEGPVGAMRDLAASNESFAAIFDRADTTGDGVPDRTVEEVLAAFVAGAPEQADRVLSREEGTYRAARIGVVVDGRVDPSVIATEMDTVAAAARTDGATATLAGQPIVNELVQRQLATTTVRGLLLAVLAVLAVLLGAFRYRRGSATLGAVTLLPVLIGLSWILGAMSLVGIPFSFATAMIGSIAIGLGVDYAIHVSERFSHELERHGDVETALVESIVGTGGALLNSALTTAAGFGVLAFALVPVMQQFGLIIALTIVFAFVASVLVLPSLLVLWTRYLGPAEFARSTLPDGSPTGRSTGGD